MGPAGAQTWSLAALPSTVPRVSYVQNTNKYLRTFEKEIETKRCNSCA